MLKAGDRVRVGLIAPHGPLRTYEGMLGTVRRVFRECNSDIAEVKLDGRPTTTEFGFAHLTKINSDS